MLPVCCVSLRSLVSASHLSSETSGPTAAPVTLKAAVGYVGGAAGAGNIPSDVQAVQRLLNTAHQRTGIPKKSIGEDGKVGPETIGAINEFQDSHLGFHDSVIQPGKRTITRLNEIAAGGVGFGKGKQSALEAVPLAITWATGAQTALQRLTGTSFLGAPGADVQVVNTHFHLDRLKGNHAAYVRKLRHVFALTIKVLNDAQHYIHEKPGQGWAEAFVGGYQFKNSPLFNRIMIRDQFAGESLKARAAMLLHECAHFVGLVGEIGHFAREVPAPHGAPDGGTRNYSQLLPDEAVRNAYSYAAYAIHAATGVDSRFGLGNS